jgi:hypothetical protein
MREHTRASGPADVGALALIECYGIDRDLPAYHRKEEWEKGNKRKHNRMNDE